MGRRSKQSKRIQDLLKTGGNMNYTNLKRNVVARGMPFEEVVNGDFPRLMSWLDKNFNNKIDTSLLDAFDDWMDENIEDKALIHQSLRLGYIGERDEEGNVIKTKRVRGLKKKKIKRERTSEGIFAGTKKALTFQLQKEGLSKQEVIDKVMEAFPDAKEKSIGIWYKKSQKANEK